MRTRAFLHELIVPGLVLIGTALFWLSIREAPSISQRVPIGVMIFIVVMAVAVVGRAALLVRSEPSDRAAEPIGEGIRAWGAEWAQRLAFIALGIGYYYAFTAIGFSLANLVFLVAALLVAGYHRGRPALAAAWRIALIALVATVVFHFLAQVMDFNVPRGPLGF